MDAPAADPPRTSVPRCNLQCLLRVLFQKPRFLQGFAAFVAYGFRLGDVKKPWFFHGFGFQEGVRTGTFGFLTALAST